MRSSLEDLVAKRVMSSVIKQIDVDKLAAKLAPDILKRVEKAILTSVTDMDLTDFLYDVMPYKELREALRKQLIKGLNK